MYIVISVQSDIGSNLKVKNKIIILFNTFSVSSFFLLAKRLRS